MSLCYCGSGKNFDECCEPYILGAKKAPTAEAVLRARFSAHCTGNLDWLDTTTHPDTRDEVEPEEMEAWNKAAKWISLEILSSKDGQENDERGEISFKAKYTINGMPQELIEDSFFKKENDTWYYVDGNVHSAEPAKRDPKKVGRNDPCSCGSGKKYKKCCGMND